MVPSSRMPLRTSESSMTSVIIAQMMVLKKPRQMKAAQ